MTRLGFVLLTHTKPRQSLRLVGRLRVLFGDPVIVCHHDFSKCDLDAQDFPPCVRFVRPHHVTTWGNFSLVEAVIGALRLMYGLPEPPEWFTLLSGADYPAAKATVVLRDLDQGGVDAFVHHEVIDPRHARREWHGTCQQRYLRKRLTMPCPTRRGILARRTVTFSPRLSRYFLPFTPDFQCFAGSQWFTANHRCAERILRWHGDGLRGLRAHYQAAPIPDESYFQCMLCNDPTLRIRNDNKRYTEWVPGAAHPRTLGAQDLPKIIASGCHFARKFDPDHDSSVLDALDALLG
jgi:hypothetical protein